MIVNVKKLDVKMELKTNGIEFEVRDNGDEFLGDFIISKSGLIWCKGKTSRANGCKKTWDEVIDFFENN